MTVFTPFPLFNLPKVAIHDVLIKTMPIELIQLSLVSKKSNVIVKSFLKRNSTVINYKLYINLWSPYDHLEMKLSHENYKPFKVRFLSTKHSYFGYAKLTLMKFNDFTVFAYFGSKNKVLNVFCQDTNTTSNHMLRYFCKLFNPIITVNFCSHVEVLPFGLLDVIKIENAKLDKFSLRSFSASDHLYQRLLDSPIRILKLLPPPSANFQYKISNEPMKFKKLKINYAQWVRNLDDFLHCKSVILHNTHFMGEDLNRFLRTWKESSDCQLEYLHIHTQINELNLNDIVEGLSAEPLYEVNTTNRFQSFEDGECFSFHRNNGQKAVIFQDERDIIIHTYSHHSI